MPNLGFWKKQLVTHEDPGHIHKVLGISCLISILWRFSMSGSRDMGFALYPELTLPTLFLHFCLSASSLVFSLPKKRIKSGDRIWPEYRLHAIVFLSRSLAIMAVTWYEQEYHLEPNYDLYLVIVMLTMAGSSLGSWWVGSNHSDSIRGLDVHPALQVFFSFSQLALTSYCLYGLHRFSLVFLAAAVIQLTPLTMTLRRKHLINTPGFMALYAVQLVVASAVAYYETVAWEGAPKNCSLIHGTVLGVAVVLRLGPRFPILRYIQENKFLLWLCIGVGWRRWLLPLWNTEELPLELVVANRVLMAATLVVFLWKGFLRDGIRCESQQLAQKSLKVL